ncbi:MAG: hypothetical protein NVS3B10_17800 [Polyangiales bacterium]
MGRVLSICGLISVLALVVGCGGDKVNFSPPDVADAPDESAVDDAPADGDAALDTRLVPDSAASVDVHDGADSD